MRDEQREVIRRSDEVLICMNKVKLGRGGAEQVVEYDLTADERAALEASATAVRELCANVDRLMMS